jgi:hypothetical protein
MKKKIIFGLPIHFGTMIDNQTYPPQVHNRCAGHLDLDRSISQHTEQLKSTSIPTADQSNLVIVDLWQWQS